MTATNSAGLPIVSGRHMALADETKEIVALMGERDRARDALVSMEAREERKAQTLEKVRHYAKNLVGEWGSGHIGLDLLAMLDADRDDDYGPVTE